MNNNDTKLLDDLEDKKVPLEQVLDDMYNNSGVQYEARQYYYKHYATDEERQMMDKEDSFNTKFGITMIAFIVISGALIILSHIL